MLEAEAAVVVAAQVMVDKVVVVQQMELEKAVAEPEVLSMLLDKLLLPELLLVL